MYCNAQNTTLAWSSDLKNLDQILTRFTNSYNVSYCTPQTQLTSSRSACSVYCIRGLRSERIKPSGNRWNLVTWCKILLPYSHKCYYIGHTHLSARRCTSGVNIRYKGLRRIVAASHAIVVLICCQRLIRIHDRVQGGIWINPYRTPNHARVVGRPLQSCQEVRNHRHNPWTRWYHFFGSTLCWDCSRIWQRYASTLSCICPEHNFPYTPTLSSCCIFWVLEL